MKDLFKTTLLSIVIIISLAILTFIAIQYFKGNSLDYLVKHSYETSEITTDLKDGSFTTIQLYIVADGRKAKSEISKRDFQVRNILIKELAHFTKEELLKDLEKLEMIVKERLNDLMTEGEIIEVSAIEKRSQ